MNNAKVARIGKGAKTFPYMTKSLSWPNMITMVKYAPDINGICKECPYHAYIRVDENDHDVCVYDDKGKCFQRSIERYFVLREDQELRRRMEDEATH